MEVLNKIEAFYEKNDIGKLLWSCGLGKTLLSILMVEKLEYKKIVIGVPSIYLQNQFVDEIMKIYPNLNNILCVGSSKNCYINSTTDISRIKLFMKQNNNSEPLFLISTYASCNLLANCLKDIDIDFKIGDEAHHLVGIEEDKETKKKLQTISRYKGKQNPIYDCNWKVY